MVGEDGCGNVAQAERDFLVDSLRPAITFDGAADGGIYDAPLTVSFAATDTNLTSVEGKLDGNPVGFRPSR